MEILQLIFFTVIVIAAIVRVSILPGKVWIPFVLCCGVVAVILTNYMSGVTPGEIERELFSKSVVTCQFVELFLFIAMVLYPGTLGKIMKYYPSIMIFVPVALLSSVASRSFPGLDFMVSALITGLFVCLICTLLILLFRYLKFGKESLYKVSLLGILISIIYYGML